MTWTIEIIERIQHLFPTQRGNVVIDYLTFFQALHYIAENGCKWRALPKHFGNWNSIYCRFRYWAVTGVFDRIEKELRSQVFNTKGVKQLALDSTYVKVHPNGTGASPKRAAIHRHQLRHNKTCTDSGTKYTTSLLLSSIPSSFSKISANTT